MSIISLSKKTEVTKEMKLAVQDKIMEFESVLSKMPNATFGDDACPLKHTFVDGAYVREIRMPKGMLLTSKIHKIQHPYFILEGECSVLTDKGTVRIKAPYYGITEPTTKRILYMWEDTVWVTVHVTKERDLKKIEEQIIAKNFDAVLPSREEVKKLQEV